MDLRVARDVARMLRGRLLLHYVDGRYLRCRPQGEHTLSTWTIHRLVRQTGMRRFLVRPRPEFWQPEQRRPRAPWCSLWGRRRLIDRQRRFDAREVQAVRAVLRFLEHVAGPPPASRPSAPECGPAPPPGRRGPDRHVARVARRSSAGAKVGARPVLRGRRSARAGTGKERLARAIHATSPRSQGPSSPVNCGAIAADVLTAELFGHIRGAFTGAHQSRAGLIARAHRGTLFLDEVADMPAPMQVALLRVLEDRDSAPGGERARAGGGPARGLRHEPGPGRRDRGRAVPRGPLPPR